LHEFGLFEFSWHPNKANFAASLILDIPVTISYVPSAAYEIAVSANVKFEKKNNRNKYFFMI
jgi:hypothetical protein